MEIKEKNPAKGNRECNLEHNNDGISSEKPIGSESASTKYNFCWIPRQKTCETILDVINTVSQQQQSFFLK